MKNKEVSMIFKNRYFG